MKVKALMNVVCVVPKEVAKPLVEKATTTPYPYKINGDAYYMSNCTRHMSGSYQMTFVSKDVLEIEVSTDDYENPEGESKE